VVATLEEANELKADAERKEVRVTVPQPRSRRGRVTWEDLSKGIFFKPGKVSPATDGDYALSAYLRRIIERDREPRPTTRGLYLRGVRIHIDPHRSPRPMSAISTYGTGHWEQVACRPWRTRMAIVQPQPVIGNVDGKGRPAAAICFLRTH
jgi:hypothetical protein